MTKILRAALTVSALLAFAISCDTGDDSQYAGPDDTTPATRQVEPGDDSQYAGPDDTTPATRQVEADSATPTPKVVWVVKWPDSWPVPPLPVMWLEHQSGPTRGSPQSYCWQLENAADRVCEEYTIWSGVREYPETALGAHIPIKIDADTRPTKMFAQVFTRPGTIMVGGLRRLSTISPGLDLAGLGPGVYNIRLIGYWEDNKVAYEFGLRIPGVVKLKSECSQTTADADPILALESLDDRLRTAPDSFNGGGCWFNKPIAHVSLTLQNGDLGSYTETFRIDPPAVSVGFPLRDGLASEKTGEPLPPGEYSRRIVVVAEDGEELEITSAFQDVVTLAAP